VFILEHYFASKSFAFVREAFSNVLIEDWRVVRSVSKANCGAIVLPGDSAERYQNLLTQFISLLEENETNC
jgi:hypothetical protein